MTRGDGHALEPFGHTGHAIHDESTLPPPAPEACTFGAQLSTVMRILACIKVKIANTDDP